MTTRFVFLSNNFKDLLKDKFGRGVGRIMVIDGVEFVSISNKGGEITMVPLVRSKSDGVTVKENEDGEITVVPLVEIKDDGVIVQENELDIRKDSCSGNTHSCACNFCEENRRAWWK